MSLLGLQGYAAYVQAGQVPPDWPYPPDVWEYATQRFYRGTKEVDVIQAPLWSTEQLVSGAQTLSFFQKVYNDKVNGNLKVAGLMPSPYAILVRAVRLVPLNAYFFNGTTISGSNLFQDIANIIYNSMVRITIGSKDFGEYPSHMLPGGSGVFGQLALATTATSVSFHEGFVTNGFPAPQFSYSLEKPLFIGEQQTFSATLQTIVGGLTLATTPGINLQLIWDGLLFRPIS